MCYDNDYLDKINSSVDLLSYASKQLDFIKKDNHNYFTHCPKHLDATPSLSINTDKNLFYCFSCGIGGGIIQWINQIEGLQYDKAVIKAARLAGIGDPVVCRSKTLNYNTSLKKSNSVKNTYTKPHTILNESILNQYKKTQIGLWLQEGISQKTLDQFDIRMDTTGNRIVYPVRDINGELINIKGRTLCPDYKTQNIAKYINYYKVGTMDYFQSLNLTLPYIQQSGEIKIFESIKSVMKMWNWGIKDCVSAEKHTLTDEQIKILIKLGVDVIFCYDSDVDYFGEKKVVKNINVLKRFTNVYIIDDRNHLLGGTNAKNSPADCGKEIWEQLYNERRRL